MLFLLTVAGARHGTVTAIAAAGGLAALLIFYHFADDCRDYCCENYADNDCSDIF